VPEVKTGDRVVLKDFTSDLELAKGTQLGKLWRRSSRPVTGAALRRAEVLRYTTPAFDCDIDLLYHPRIKGRTRLVGAGLVVLPMIYPLSTLICFRDDPRAHSRNLTLFSEAGGSQGCLPPRAYRKHTRAHHSPRMRFIMPL
jgi:hypothetical protein